MNIIQTSCFKIASLLYSVLIDRNTLRPLISSIFIGYFCLIITPAQAHIKCPFKFLGTTNDKCPHGHYTPKESESGLGGNSGPLPSLQQGQTYIEQQRKREQEQRRQRQEQQRRQNEINRRNAETFFYLCVKNNYEKCSSIYRGNNKKLAQSTCRRQGYPGIVINKSQQYLNRVTQDNCFISTFTMPVR